MRVDCLLHAPDVSVFRVDHAAEHVPAATEEEPCDHFGVNFVIAGEFGLGIEKRRWRLRGGDVFVSHPSAVHTYSHFSDTAPDTCLSVVFEGALASEIERQDALVRGNGRGGGLAE